jgi:hypothetical protein
VAVARGVAVRKGGNARAEATSVTPGLDSQALT